jgi:reactive intermediate/imine deaminase
MAKEIVEVPVLSEVTRRLGAPLSLVVKANGFVFVSGTPPLDVETGAIVRGDFATQSEAALKALAHCLKAAGVELSDVVSVRIFAEDIAGWDAFNAIYRRYFPKDPPARTFVAVKALPAGFALEIEAVAIA